MSPNDEPISPKKKNPCYCSKNLLKTIVLFLNMIIIFAAMAVVGACAFLISKRSNDIAVLMGEVYYASTYIILICAVITLFTCVIGFVAICKSMPTLQTVYVSVLAVLFITELIALILSVALKGSLESSAHHQLNHTMLQSYKTSAALTSATDIVQSTWRCCGIHTFRDWRYAPDDAFASSVPSSCCISSAQSCGRLLHPSNIFYNGCLTKIKDFMHEHSFYIGLVTSGVVVCEGVMLFFAGWLLHAVRHP